MIQYCLSPRWLMLVMLGIAIAIPTASQAQNYSSQSGSAIEIDESIHQIEIFQGTSRVLKFPYRVPDLIVENQDTLQATPISADQILVTGKKIGVSSVTITDEEGNPRTINVQIKGDVRALESQLQGIFPDAIVRATALKTSVVLQGTAASASQIPLIMSVAKDYFPEVHNNLRVGDSQMVAIEVKVYEISRTKLRQAGIDWNIVANGLSINSTAGGVGVPNLTFNVLNGGEQLNGFLDLLERNTLAKLLDSPVLVAMNGRPAEFLEGGEIPFQVNQGLGQNSIEFRPFGTKLDVVPLILGQNRIRLEIRAEVSEPSVDLTSADGTPGFRVRRVNTGVEMKMGHTLALAGDYREEVEAQSSGFPVLKNTPYLGTLFRRVTETKNELELVITLTPRYVAETDPANLPPIGPGQSTASPSDCELFLKGHIEVPRCQDDCPGPQGLTPAQPVQYHNGLTDSTTNQYLEGRPEELPQVLREYQQQFPEQAGSYGNSHGQQSQGSFGYPGSNQNQQMTPATPASNWPSNSTQPSNSSWPSPAAGTSNSTNRPAYNVSSRRVMNR